MTTVYFVRHAQRRRGWGDDRTCPLSDEGLPCPNLSTGGYGFHSCVEFIPVSSLEKMTKVLMHIAGA